jgi:uncharacterized protein (TIGR00290 family)
MVWAALTSGRKDSLLSCQKAVDDRKMVRYKVTARLKNHNSSMFHSANLDAIPVSARVTGIEYMEIETQGNKEEELENIDEGLAAVDIGGVIAGAIGSMYQAERVKTIPDRLGLALFTPLWHGIPRPSFMRLPGGWMR